MADILVIEDEAILARNISELLQMAGHKVLCASSGQEGAAAAAAGHPDLILLDFRLPDIDGFDVINALVEEQSQVAIVMMTAHGNVPMAVKAMKAGVADFLTKPLDLDELLLIVEHALHRRRQSRSLAYLHERDRAVTERERMIGTSATVQQFRRFVERITASPALASEFPPTVLITGETGTGKDLAARALHYTGPRSAGQFVHINCTALPETLIESELFGHVKGAFTDARGDRTGLFEVADGGTIFLDEIGHMPATLQAKLLSVLERRTIRRVGATRERSINVHVIAATHRDLPAAVAAGEFREDLYHRLRTLTVNLAPLRERGDDILELADYFRRSCALKCGLGVTGFTPDARAVLAQHDWPGNVRELSHTVESAVLLVDGREVRPEHLNIRRPGADAPEPVADPETTTLVVDFDSGGASLEDIKFEILQAALKVTDHNATRAARLLGISRDAIRYRLEKRGQRESEA